MARYIDADKLIEEIDLAQEELKTNNDALWEIRKKTYKALCRLRRMVLDMPVADVVEVKQGEILLPLCIEELRHLINDAIFYIRKMENCKRNKAEFGYFSRIELLEKLKNVERYYEMLNMPVCKQENEGGADDEER